MNEITAILPLLTLLQIKGGWVTVYVMGCQKKFAQTIIHKGADCLLGLKGDQETLITAINS
ncbi:MAG: putative transposase YbfD/YdcC [Paraglaciecola sp.]